jgi:hypothetical protein
MNRSFKYGLGVALGALLVEAALVLPLSQWAEQLVEWIRGAGATGVAVYAVAYVTATLLLLPGSLSSPIPTMPKPPTPSIREILLTTIHAQQPPPNSNTSLQQKSVLEAAERALGLQYGNRDMEEAVLTEWGELFRTGLLAWGMNLMNPNPPFFHLTERGRQALATVTRDPSNPAGYMRHLASLAKMSTVTNSYLTEGLDCYVAGLYKAAAVMVGAAAESIILDLRDSAVQKLTAGGIPVPVGLNDWRIKAVTGALTNVFDRIDGRRNRELRERYEAYWTAFPHQIRTVRNDAGHPTSIDPVTPDTVHASLLVFPELAKLAAELKRWIEDDLA